MEKIKVVVLARDIVRDGQERDIEFHIPVSFLEKFRGFKAPPVIVNSVLNPEWGDPRSAGFRCHSISCTSVEEEQKRIEIFLAEVKAAKEWLESKEMRFPCRKEWEI